MTVQRKRGLVLGIWLSYLLFSNGWGVYRLIEIILDEYRHGVFHVAETSTWLGLALVVVELVVVASIVAMWFWRKLGCHVYAICTIIAVVITLVGGAMTAFVFLLVSLAVTWVLLQSRSDDFV